jgi:FkbM family methyltransferase
MLTTIVKEASLKLGFEIKRYSIAQNQTARLIKILDDHKINVVFDIGANAGQFGEELRKLAYTNKIVSFEPLLEPYNKLIELSKEDSSWQIAPRGAIGEDDGEIEINIAGNSASSSILEMMDSHIKAAPTTKSIGIELVPIRKLDSLANTYLQKESILFVKIDTQGYEDKVINGGIETIERATVLQTELSLIELYSGQKLMIEMIEKITNMGFELWGVEPAFVDSNSGRMLQVDAIFCRKS